MGRPLLAPNQHGVRPCPCAEPAWGASVSLRRTSMGCVCVPARTSTGCGRVPAPNQHGVRPCQIHSGEEGRRTATLGDIKIAVSCDTEWYRMGKHIMNCYFNFFLIKRLIWVWIYR